MKRKTHLWAWIALAVLIAVLISSCATLDGLLGVDNANPTERPKALEAVESVGLAFGPVGQALASVLTALAGAYVLIRRARKSGDADHSASVSADAALRAELEDLKKKVNPT